jgi:ATP-dependent DNA helicase RecG
MDALDPALVSRYLQKIRANSYEDALVARGLAVRENSSLHPTTAGLLVLGRQPQAVFPEALVRVLRYGGSSRETGARANVITDRRVEGPVAKQIDGARRLVQRWAPSVTRLGRGGRFARTTLIPAGVWLEAIVNAVTHRSYSIGGDHVRVEIFDDRIEVESPGRLPGLVRLENIRSTRFARNPRIARALNDLGYGRELGEGVDRMYEDMGRAGLPEPVFRQGPASVVVALLADPIAARLLDHLPPGSERFVEHFAQQGRLRTTDAVDLLRASRPIVLGYLHRLVREGLIEHVASSPNDPRGYWRLRSGASRERGLHVL